MDTASSPSQTSTPVVVPRANVSMVDASAVTLNKFHSDERLRDVKVANAGPVIVRKEDRVTPKYLSRYERVRLLGARASELSQGRGEPIALDWNMVRESSNASALTDALAIAEEELRQGVLPLDVRRVRADESCEDWGVDELIWEDSSVVDASTCTKTL
jgi:DNA-directed RNA polymerase subunit K/omega